MAVTGMALDVNVSTVTALLSLLKIDERYILPNTFSFPFAE